MPAPATQGVDAGVEVSLNPEDLDLADQKGLEKKYEEQLRKQTRGRQDEDEDFSDMVAEHSAKQNVCVSNICYTNKCIIKTFFWEK